MNGFTKIGLRVSLLLVVCFALSRGVAGVRGRTLVVNVPGSVKGATESLEAVMPMLGHAIRLLHGNTAHA